MVYTVSVLQIKHGDKFHYYKFSSLRMLNKMGLKVDLDNYDTIYTTSVEYDGNIMSLLEKLYVKFQGSKPEGYNGHSLSISDIIKLNNNYFYCDSFGFKQINF